MLCEDADFFLSIGKEFFAFKNFCTNTLAAPVEDDVVSKIREYLSLVTPWDASADQVKLRRLRHVNASELRRIRHAFELRDRDASDTCRAGVIHR